MTQENERMIVNIGILLTVRSRRRIAEELTANASNNKTGDDRRRYMRKKIKEKKMNL